MKFSPTVKVILNIKKPRGRVIFALQKDGNLIINFILPENDCTLILQSSPLEAVIGPATIKNTARAAISPPTILRTKDHGFPSIMFVTVLSGGQLQLVNRFEFSGGGELG